MDNTAERAVAAEREVEREERHGWGVPPGFASCASFLAALARGESTAVRELYRHYTPMLREQARAAGVGAADRRELVTVVLETFALHLMEGNRPPVDMARYMVAAVRNRARNLYRDRLRRQARYDSAYEQCTGTAERIIAECHSEYGIRASRAPEEPEPPRIPNAIERLAARSALALSDDERHLMVGLSCRVPLRELAAQLGIGYGAARVRVHRLRERFRKLARQHLDTLDPAERRELERFFRRAKVHLAIAEPRGGSDD